MIEKRKGIPGLGNLLQKDEGPGIHVLTALAETLTIVEKESLLVIL